MAKISLTNWEKRFLSIEFWFATALGAGLLKPAPGTWGSLAGIFVAVGALSTGLNGYIFLAILFLTFLAGTAAINRIEKQAGIHDAPEIVIDEVVGQWIPLIPLFSAGNALDGPTWFYLLAAFILFRGFDIIKPWPIGWIDSKITGGFGVMIDDIIAGLFAWGILEVAYYFV